LRGIPLFFYLSEIPDLETFPRQSVWKLPLAQLSSSPLSIRRYLGLSGNHGRNKSWANAGTQLLDSKRGQYASAPNISLGEMWGESKMFALQ